MDHRTPKASRPGREALVVGSLTATIGVLPVFLLGAVAVLVRAELGFSEAQLGVTVSLFWAAASLNSVPAGRLVERLDGPRGLALATGVGGTALLLAAASRSWGMLTVSLLLGGTANALSQPAANLRIARAVAQGRQGLAFGVKQASVPTATLAGGLAVPAVALPLGWRWVFVLAALVGFGVSATQLRKGNGAATGRARPRTRAHLALLPLTALALAGAFGSAAVTAMAAFIVEYGVSVGIEPALAGLVLAAGSGAAIVVRVMMGWRADRHTKGNLLVVASMIVIGAGAVASFPLTTTWFGFLVAAILAYAIGWGWPGLFNLAIVRRNRQAPAAATGFTQAGVYVGGAIGPLCFGLLVTAFGYPLAWRAASASLVASAALMLLGRVLARRAWLPRTPTTT